MTKRYYWLKLNENFFEEDTIAWLEEQENGKDYVLFYLKLALRSLQDDGSLVRYVGEKLIPYDIKSLAKVTNTPIDTVAVAMKVFIEIGLIAQLETGEIYMNQINELIGSETESAKRVRKHRAKELTNDTQEIKTLHCNSDVIKSNTDIEKEIKSIYGEFKNVKLTQSEYLKLIDRLTETKTLDMIERLSAYIEQKGKRYKSHYATILNWIRRDEDKKPIQKEIEVPDYMQEKKGSFGDYEEVD